MVCDLNQKHVQILGSRSRFLVPTASSGASTLYVKASLSWFGPPRQNASYCSVRPRGTWASWTLSGTQQTASRGPSLPGSTDLETNKNNKLIHPITSKHRVLWSWLLGTLTLDESLPHEVVIHGFRNNFSDFIALVLYEGVTFAPTGLQRKGKEDVNNYSTEKSSWKHLKLGL